MRDFFERYADRIIPEPNTGCFLWLGAVASIGYGHGHRNGEHFYAHRAAYEAVHGRIRKGLVVRHSCDNPPCCNPDHLLVGTHLDNVRDSIRRGRFRSAIGERVHTAKLTERDVLEARKRASNGESLPSLLKRFPVGRMSLEKAIVGRTWRHLGGATDYVRCEPKPPAPRLGENNATAILTDREASAIIRRLKSGERGIDLARAFGVSHATISAIKHGRLRRHQTQERNR